MSRSVAVRGVALSVFWFGLSTALLAQGTATQQNPTATFSTPGAHEVTLTVCNVFGQCDTKTQTVTVLDPRPSVLSAAALVATAEAGQAIPLFGTGKGQPPLNYTWRVYQGLTLVKELAGASSWWQTGGLAPGLYTAVMGITNASGVAESLPQLLLVNGATPLDFYTIEPCRVLDTRFGSPLGTGAAKIVSLAGTCGIPATARAVAANVTIPAPAINGNVSLYPGNYPAVGTSTINFVAGSTIANNAMLPLATDGTGTVAALAGLPAGTTVNLVIDVAGYYVPEAP